MFEMIKTLKPELCAQVVEHLRQLPMKQDKSSYAQGRKILWINREPSYGREVSIRRSYEDERIFSFCQRIFAGHFQVDYVLVSYSGNAYDGEPDWFQEPNPSHGISWHRDASYAAPIAGTINFGDAEFGIKGRDDSLEVGVGNEEWYSLGMGDVCKFNCKHPHMCDPSIERWAIHCWSAK